jgi:hypothetical protein
MGDRARTIDAWLSRLGSHEGRLAPAGWASLAAARVREQDGSLEDARLCRTRAIEFWTAAERQGEAITDQGLAAAQLAFADTLRRLGRFDEARGCCHRGLSGHPPDPVRSLLEYEIELISQEDTAAHSVDEVGRGGRA